MELKRFTDWRLEPEADTVRLVAEDRAGAAVDLRLPLDQIGSLMMTLPGLLSAAMQARYGDPSLRYVFPLKNFRLETADLSHSVILSLATHDGFEVSFVAGREMAAALSKQLDDAPETPCGPVRLN